MRKLVTVQEITDVRPVENSDFLDVVRVLGWNVVTRRGDFIKGQKALFFEIDSLLPESRPEFDEFQTRGQRSVILEDGTEVVGHVLRTAKLRGTLSQGLIMPLSTFGIPEDAALDTDITELTGVVKWEAPLPSSGNIIGSFDTRFAPKTGATRVQTLAEHWDEIVTLPWVPTLKVDGTSQTVMNVEGQVRFFGHNWELDVTSKDTVGFRIAKKAGLIDVIQENPGMAIQFELAGPKIQRNMLKLPELRVFVFSVWQDGVKLPREQWDERLLPVATPVMSDEWLPVGTIDEMIEKVSGLRGTITPNTIDEGIVFHFAGDVAPEWLDGTGNFKIISNKFLLKEG